MFTVINLKKILKPTILIVFLFTIYCYVSDYSNEILYVSAQKRLLPIYSVETNQKIVSLTFDCAWGADDIPDIIKTLTKNNITATFFTVGDWVMKYSESISALAETGMEIGNHSYSHAHVNNLSLEENIKDMKKCNELIENITNTKVKYYRGPYGEYNNTVMSAAESENMKVVQWDIDTLDYTGKTPDEMCERIKSKLRNGSIILMHNDTKYTAQGLQQIIDTIRNEGYEIIPLDELIYKENYTINHEGRQISNN